MKPGESLALAAVVLLAITGVALTLRQDSGTEPEPVTGSQPGESAGERELRALLEADFGSFAAPRTPEGFAASGLPQAGSNGDARLQLGRGVFRTQCLQCHGASGRADTTTAAMLTPRPRDFSLGILKFTTTTAGSRARREDLLHTLREGIPWTAMSAFSMLREPAVLTLADYTMWILIRGELERAAQERLLAGTEPAQAYAEAHASVASAWDPIHAPVVEVPDFNADDPTARERGARLYADPAVNCAACHGADGGGRGPTVWDEAAKRWLLTDAWGMPAQPRDLRRAQYHGGDRPEDLYRRIHAGVKGTPMPGFGERLSATEIADLVAYLRGIAER